MQRLYVQIGLLFFIAVAFAQNQLPNLIQNGSLEDKVAQSGLPEGWEWFSQPEQGYKFSVASSGRTGSKSLLIEGNGEYAGVLTQRAPLDRAKRYCARGWLKVEGDEKATGTIKLDYYDGENKFLGSTVAGLLNPEIKDWQLVAVTDRAQEFPQAKSIATVVALTGKGKAWFDDLEMVARDAATVGTGLLANGSMETIAGSTLPNWLLVTSPDGKSTLRWSADQPKDGWYAMHMKGAGEWSVAVSEKIPFDKNKAHRLTGYARAKQGRAQIKIDYFKDNEYLGMTGGEEITVNEWQRQIVLAEPSQFPSATHIAAAAVGLGEFEAFFDSFVLTAR